MGWAFAAAYDMFNHYSLNDGWIHIDGGLGHAVSGNWWNRRPVQVGQVFSGAQSGMRLACIVCRFRRGRIRVQAEDVERRHAPGRLVLFERLGSVEGVQAETEEGEAVG